MKLPYIFQAALLSAALLSPAIKGAEEVIDLTPKTLTEIKFEPTDQKSKDFLKRKEIPEIDDFKINKKTRALPKRSDLEAVLNPPKSSAQAKYAIFAQEGEKRKIEGSMLLQKYQPNIATVLCVDKESLSPQGIGSGFFLSPNLFITVDHLTERTRKEDNQLYALIYTSTKTGRLVKATVLGSSKNREISLCLSDSPLRDTQPVEIAAERPFQGDSLFAAYQEFHTKDELGRNLTNPNEKIRTIPFHNLQFLIERTYIDKSHTNRSLTVNSDTAPSYVLCIGNSGFITSADKGIKTNVIDPLIKEVELDSGPSKKWLYTGFLKGERGNSGSPVFKDGKLAGIIAIAGTETNHCFIVPPETIRLALRKYAKKLPELEEKLRKERK